MTGMDRRHIVARKGSGGVPRKTIRAFCAEPLIDWSPDQLFAHPGVDEVLISPDGGQIDDHAVAQSALMIGSRPAHLAEHITLAPSPHREARTDMGPSWSTAHKPARKATALTGRRRWIMCLRRQAASPHPITSTCRKDPRRGALSPAQPERQDD